MVKEGDTSSRVGQEDREAPHIKDEREDPEPPHVKENQEVMGPPHIKEDQENREPTHIKEEQEDPEPPHIKEEQEELWSSQEGEQLQGLEEADITKFPFTPVPVKSEDDEEKPQSSQLHQRLTEQMETEADGEDCGGPEPDRNSHPDGHLRLVREDSTGNSLTAEIAVNVDDWKETREPQSGSTPLKNDQVPLRDSKSSVGEKPFGCSQCGKRFGSNWDLKVHMRTHTGEKPFSCSECEKRFGTKWDMKRHMITHTGEKPFSCSVCNKSFTKCSNVKNHMRIHTGEKPFSCNVCNNRFVWRSQQKRHKCVGRQSSQLHQSQTEQMKTDADGEDCGGPEPARNSHPDTHLQPDTEDKTGDSSEPETEDSDDWRETREPQSGLNSLKNDQINEKPFSCSECGKRFDFNWCLKQHMGTHTGEKPFCCTKCGKTFGRKEYLKKHMKFHKGEKPFSCSLCGKRFIHKVGVTQHMIVHTGEKPFSCAFCKKSFAWKKCLQLHMKFHTGERLYNCSVCDKRFPSKVELRTHTRTHTGEKPFNCSFCEKSFAHSGNLLKHMRIHTGEKPFSCSVCGKGFLRTDHLGRHMRTHWGKNQTAAGDREDCAGPEPARSSDPDAHLQPETEDKTGDSSRVPTMMGNMDMSGN
ncbi:zinc finger protein 2-like [Plectropomus leopardus]|uniref:zinc finger protein 2-like n=1 Tax=Plectropomus leopardus TaxID=160734 RepID=UPI001C4CE6B6|nr:zinc finger protein 2-like [Plectropomus leopardus]